MSEKEFFDILLPFWFLLAFVTFPVLFLIPAPYGRYGEKEKGRTIPNNLGWLIMESPAVYVMAIMFLLGPHRQTLAAIALLAMWMAHYLHRAFVYSLLQRGREKRIPLRVVALAFAFNLVNGYLNGRHLFRFSGGYAESWLADGRFLLGVVLFVVGYAVNRRADARLRDLRAPDASDYKIPRGGLYRWVSCPNYLGEIVIWFGWAVATWSLPGLAFALWTAANLVPRAWSHHRWYRKHFGDYPADRAALIPGIW